MRTTLYPSDLTDQQWELIKPLLPKTRHGRPRKVSLRRVINALLYLHHTGCQWAYLPKTYPRPGHVFYYFARWSKTRVWEKICHSLHSLLRVVSQRNPCPRLAIVDAQSVRSPRGEERAFDGFKRVMGRKRNILVDALGIIIGCKVHRADHQETMTAKNILDQLPIDIDQSLETIVADKGYRGALVQYAETYHGINVDIVDRKVEGTNMRRKRWIVERTFAWLNHYRRMSRDYEHKVRNSESMLYISMLPILLHRLAA